MINFKYSKQKKGKENEKKEERKKFSLSKKQWYPFPFDVLNHSRHQKRFRNVSISSEPCSLRAFILFFPPSLRRLPRCTVAQLISPSQFKQGVQSIRPSPIYFSYGSIFFPSLFLCNRPAFPLIVAADFSIGRTLLLAVSFS